MDSQYAPCVSDRICPPLALLVAAGGGIRIYLHHGNLSEGCRGSAARMAIFTAPNWIWTAICAAIRIVPRRAFRLGTIKLATRAIWSPPNACCAGPRRVASATIRPQIVMPLGETYLQQHRFDDLLADFTVEARRRRARKCRCAGASRLRLSRACTKSTRPGNPRRDAMAAAPGRAQPRDRGRAGGCRRPMTRQAAEAKIDGVVEAKDPKQNEAAADQDRPAVAPQRLRRLRLKVSANALLAANPDLAGRRRWPRRATLAGDEPGCGGDQAGR